MADTERKEKVKKALEYLDNGVLEFFQSDHFKEYLKVMGRFHHYSARNCILIASQLQRMGYPGLDGRICGYNDWKNHFNRQVKKGEKGIMILAPMKRSIEVEVAGKLDANGDPIKEKTEFTTFRPVYVFSEHQTEGEPLPELVKRLSFEVDGYEKVKNALIQAAGCPVIFEHFPEEDSINGFFNPFKNEIHIREGMSEAQTIKTLLHEEMHHLLHPDALSDKTRQEKELEAEAGAFCVASTYLGIDTSAYSIPYLGSWSEGKSISEMTAVIENIKRGSDLLIDKLDQILCLEKTEDEVAVEKKEERITPALSGTGVKAESVTIVADNPRTIALVAVTDPENEHKVLQMNGGSAGAENEMVSFITLNVNMDNTPEYYETRTEFSRENYDSSWPMVQIRYTNVPGIIRSEMNIYKFQRMIGKLPQETLDDRGKYFKVCLSYTYRDQNYQRVLDIDLGHGQVDYLNYLPIEGSHIAHLKSHVELLEVCDRARCYAPNTERGIQFEDSVQEWAGYCREILNHDSDRPVLPRPPKPERMEEIAKNRFGERRLEL